MVARAKPKNTYSWVIGPKTRKVYCYKSPRGDQQVAGLWEAEKLTSFHDAELAKATKEINAILSKIGRGNRDPDRTLSLVQFQNRPFLVWASYEIVGPDDDETMIVKALGLKVRESSQRRTRK